ncbi:universal stress protein [Nitrososphaera sp.]|uniref:universal stress protein n=1 Tax=Nitrososphaera sp. TaxID=1971748 RepID=UPI001812753C|nr:universal stress protein [Nitrososphaera sp.]NWG38321.1 universal stress protein [Nitrososphaera sp.]
MAQGRPFSNILVAYDGSASAQGALDVAIEMAKSDRARLTAVSVSTVPTALPLGPGGGGFDKIVSESRKEAKDLLEKVKERAAKSDIKISTEVLNGSHGVAAAIVNYAEDKKSDLIVMGTRGRTRLKKMLLGSVAQGVVTYASCTVMVVR